MNVVSCFFCEIFNFMNKNLLITLNIFWFKLINTSFLVKTRLSGLLSSLKKWKSKSFYEASLIWKTNNICFFHPYGNPEKRGENNKSAPNPDK